jgi:hypothetical protein
LVAPPQIEHAILLIRGQRVMLDRDLAAMYGVTTGNLNKAVQRNRSRFPADFMFQLTTDEASRFQIGILKKGLHFKYLPCVFTQEGVAMLSGVLRSPRAEQVNIAIMRAFARPDRGGAAGDVCRERRGSGNTRRQPREDGADLPAPERQGDGGAAVPQARRVAPRRQQGASVVPLTTRRKPFAANIKMTDASANIRAGVS